MSRHYQPLKALDLLDLYFIENRARLLDLAAFLDRIDRYDGAAAAKADCRYRALTKAIALTASGGERTMAIQLALSDQSTEPVESAVGLRAIGAWEGTGDEGD